MLRDYYCCFSETSSSAGVELPSELCFIIMSPVSISTFYSFSFVPSIMHRIESWNIALNLKKMHLCHSMPNGNVPAMKVYYFSLISLPFFYFFLFSPFCWLFIGFGSYHNKEMCRKVSSGILWDSRRFFS